MPDVTERLEKYLEERPGPQSAANLIAECVVIIKEYKKVVQDIENLITTASGMNTVIYTNDIMDVIYTFKRKLPT